MGYVLTGRAGLGYMPATFTPNYSRKRCRGLGTVQTTSTIVGQAGALAGAGATAVIGSIASAGGTILGLTAASLVPVVGPILAGLTMGIQALVANSGCGQTCIETSQWANQAAAQLDQLIHAYFALPTPRPKSAQAVYLASFNTIWQRLQQLCGQQGTGDAGVRCITDRQAGACTWHQTAAAVPPWGTPPAGSCWNWFNGYYDPVANDTDVYDDTVSSGSTSAAGSSAAGVTAAGSPLSSLPSWWWIAAAAALVGVGMAAS